MDYSMHMSSNSMHQDALSWCNLNNVRPHNDIVIMPQTRWTHITQDNSATLNRITSTSSHFPHPQLKFSLKFPTFRQVGTTSHIFQQLPVCFTVSLFPVDDNGTGCFVQVYKLWACHIWLEVTHIWPFLSKQEVWLSYFTTCVLLQSKSN